MDNDAYETEATRPLVATYTHDDPCGSAAAGVRLYREGNNVLLTIGNRPAVMFCPADALTVAALLLRAVAEYETWRPEYAWTGGAAGRCAAALEARC